MTRRSADRPVVGRSRLASLVPAPKLTLPSSGPASPVGRVCFVHWNSHHLIAVTLAVVLSSCLPAALPPCCPAVLPSARRVVSYPQRCSALAPGRLYFPAFPTYPRSIRPRLPRSNKRCNNQRKLSRPSSFSSWDLISRWCRRRRHHRRHRWS